MFSSWIILLFGVVMLITGIFVFSRPGESYLGLSLIFGALILVSGILQLAYGITARGIHGSGWMIAGGVIEILLGIVLCVYPQISAVLMPVFLGFWLLFKGFEAIGMADDMRALNIPGSGWTIFTAILTILWAFLILIRPVAFGTVSVVVFLGISFVMAGLTAIFFSLQLRKAVRD